MKRGARHVWFLIVLLLLPGCASTPVPHSSANSADPMLTPYYWPEWTPTSLALLDHGDNDPGISPERQRNVAASITPTAEKKTAPEPAMVEPRATPEPAQAVATEYSETGKTVRLGVTSDGSPPLHFQWMKDGQPIADATDKILTLEKVSEADAGTYVCVVRNSAGEKASQTIRLVVRKPQ